MLTLKMDLKKIKIYLLIFYLLAVIFMVFFISQLLDIRQKLKNTGEILKYSEIQKIKKLNDQNLKKIEDISNQNTVIYNNLEEINNNIEELLEEINKETKTLGTEIKELSKDIKDLSNDIKD